MVILGGVGVSYERGTPVVLTGRLNTTSPVMHLLCATHTLAPLGALSAHILTGREAHRLLYHSA